MGKRRYLGIRPYQQGDSNLFFGRDDEVKQIFFYIKSEKNLVLYSKPGYGKTSLINAGIIPRLQEKKYYKYFYIRFKAYKDEAKAPLHILQKVLSENEPKNSYLEKIIESDNSVWYQLKRIQSANKEVKAYIFIFDQFEHFFTYPIEQRIEFAKALNSTLYSQIPLKYRERIQNLLAESPDLLTTEGSRMLYEPLDIKILTAIRSDKLSHLNSIKESIPTILQNLYELSPLNKEQAANAIIKPATYIADLKSENNFDSKAFTYSDEAIEKILSVLTENYTRQIETIQLQMVCESVENQVVKNNINKVEIEHIKNLAFIRKNYYELIMEQIVDKEERERVRSFIEDGLILDDEERRLSVYEGVAIKKFGVKKESIQNLIGLHLLSFDLNSKGEVFYELSHDALVKPILKAKSKRIEEQIRKEAELKQQQKMLEYAEKQSIKAKKNRVIIILSIIAAFVSIFFALFALLAKNDAQDKALESKANLLAAYAFQELDQDPTISLRLAQEAYTIDKDNVSAFSALLNSFYNTNIFYSITGYLDENVISASISNDGKYLLTIIRNVINDEYYVQLLDKEGVEIINLKHDKEITSAEISRDNKHLLTACTDSVARVWDVNGNRILTIEQHNAILWDASFSPDGTKILTAGSDSKVMCWNISGKKLFELLGHEFDVYSANFSEDGSKIVTSGGDNKALIWNNKGKLITSCEIYEDKRFSQSMLISAVFSPDGKYILTASNDYLNKNHKARLWDTLGYELFAYIGHEDWLNNALFSPDGKHIITTSRDKTVRVWNLSGKQEKILKGHNSNVWHAMFMPDNKRIITVGDDKTVRVWNMGKRFEKYENANDISFARFSPSGLNILSVKRNNAQIWDLLGEQRAVFSGHNQKLNTAYYSPDEKMVITASDDSSACVWDIQGNLLWKIKGHSDKVNDAVFSPDGQHILTASDDCTARIWNLQGNEMHKLEKHRLKVNTVEYSPSGEYIITSGDDSCAILWNLKGKVVRIFGGHHAAVTSASFSPDGSKVITTSNDETAILWSCKGEKLHVFKGYENKVNSAEFSPDGKFIVTTSDDATARLWNLNGKEIMVFKHPGKVSSANFSPDGRYVITVFTDEKNVRTFKLWMVNLDDVIKHIDELDLYGKVWKPDEETLKMYGISKQK